MIAAFDAQEHFGFAGRRLKKLFRHFEGNHFVGRAVRLQERSAIIDDPIDRDVGITQRTQNSTVFANLIWDVNQTFRIGTEFTYRETKYRSPALLDNEGAGFHTQFQWSF